MHRRAQRGLGLIEMMVGLTVGLIVVAGASLMMVSQLADHRRLVLETQVQQDLRAAGDLILRDMRRAGYRLLPDQGIWAAAAAAPRANPYAELTVFPDGRKVTYSYAKGTEDNVVSVNEQFGYRLSGGVLQYLYGGTWQPLTDPSTVTVSDLTIAIDTQEVALDEFCTTPCAPGAACPPSLQVRDVRVGLTGTAVHDSKVVRNVTLTTRLRNDAITGACSP